MLKILFSFFGLLPFIAEAQPDLKGFNSTKGGIYYKIHNTSTGPKAGVSDYVEMHLVHKTAGDTMIFSTYEAGNEPIKFKISKPAYNGDIMEGLMMLSAGDSATFFVPSDSVYREGFIPSFTYEGGWMKYLVKVENVQTEADFIAAEKAKRAAMLKKDLELMNTYVAENNYSDPVKTKDGLWIFWHKRGKGQKVSKGNEVKVHYAGRLFNNTEFDNSFKRGEPFKLTVGQGRVIEGWELVLQEMTEGDSVTVLIPSVLGYGERSAGQIPSNALLIFDMKLEDVINPAERDVKELPAMLTYIKANKLKTKTTPAGVYYAISKKGKGDLPEEGQTMLIHYTGRLLDGTKFDSSYDRNEPIEVPLGKNRVIMGWESGLPNFNKGSKGVLVIPSAMAYGEKGFPPSIPANAPLVFEIEVVDIK